MKLRLIHRESAHTNLHMCPEIGSTLVLWVSQWSFLQLERSRKNQIQCLSEALDVGFIRRSSDINILRYLKTVYDVFLHTL